MLKVSKDAKLRFKQVDNNINVNPLRDNFESKIEIENKNCAENCSNNGNSDKSGNVVTTVATETTVATDPIECSHRL